MERIPSYKEIFRIAIPLMIGGISESISAIVDTAFMGRLGTIAMDGMGMTNIILLLVIMIGWSFSRSVQILVSQNYGAKNFENIGHIVYNALFLLFPISLLILVLLYACNDFLLRYIISNPQIRAVSSDICQIRAFGMPILMTTLIISSFFTGIGKTKVLIYSQGLSAGSNIILNYVFVFGKWGFPAMGYQGSALATVISEIIGFIVLLIYLHQHKDLIKTYYLFYHRKYLQNWVREIIRLASPMLTMHTFSLGSWVYFFSLIEKMGEKELAISMVVKQIFTAITIPGFCLANTSNTLVGQLVGSRKIEMIFPTIFKVIRINYLVLVIAAIFTYIFHVYIVSLFTTDAWVISNVQIPLIAMLCCYLFIPSSNVLFVSLSAMGNAKVPLILETLVLISYLTYLHVSVTVLHGSLFIAWLSEMQYWGCLLIFVLFYFWRFNWRKNIVYLDEKS